MTFSPDGKFIVYVTFPEGILWKANRDGSNPIQLSDPPFYPYLPRWSPDGSQILTCSPDTQGHVKSYLIPSQGGTPRPLLAGDAGRQDDPDWSPDGRRIVLHWYSTEGGSAASDIRVVDVSSGAITRIPGSEKISSPRWSPNGAFIVGLTDNTAELTVYDFKAKRWSILQKGDHGFPTWSRDGQFIYFLRTQEKLGVYRISFSGGKEERIADLTGFHFTSALGLWMGLDPEEAPILLRDVGGDDIYSLTLDGK